MPPPLYKAHYRVAEGDTCVMVCHAQPHAFGIGTTILDEVTCEECRDRILHFAMIVIKAF